MRRIFLQAKIHRATVTGALPDYEGSIGIDTLLLEAADIAPFEQVHVYNVTNGKRFITYAIPGERGEGGIVVNGAAARLVEIGQQVIICAYCILEDEEAIGWKPAIVLVDEKNRVKPGP